MSRYPDDKFRRPDPNAATQSTESDETISMSEESLAAASDPTGASSPLPKAIGLYRILRRIGEGGMGTVYEAEQEKPRRTVALKVIRPGIATRNVLRRFEQETQVLGRLQHPGIAQIYDAGTADAGFGPQPYFAMEYIRGGTLLDHVRRKGLGTRQRLELMTKICEAVHYAHQRGIIHRDLKPSNILVDPNNQPKILDFGVARATDSDIQATTLQTDVGQLIGTLAYMSPEQVAADPNELDTRSDVYALGVITYELLAGSLPYNVMNKMIPEAARIIREDDPTRLSVVSRVFRGDIETIVAKALEKDKSRRYGSAAALGDDIRRYLVDEPIVARPPSTAYQLRKFAKRNKPLVGGVAAVFAALLAGVIVSTFMYHNAEAARLAAVVARDEAQRDRDRALAAERQADDNFQLARQAVDKYLNRIAESPELKAHGLEELRRRLLSTAKEFYEQFVQQRADDPALRKDLATAYMSLADISRIIGDSDEAEHAYRRSLDISGSLSGQTGSESTDLIQRANLESNLGLLYSETNRFQEAEQAFRRAVEIEEQLAGNDPNEVDRLVRYSNMLNNMALLYATMRRADEAEQTHRQAIEMRERLVENHPDADGYANNLVASCNNLANLYATTGRAPQAEPFLQKAVEIAERNVRSYPQVSDYQNSLAASLGNLAGVFVLTGRLEEADAAYQRSLPVRQALAVRHPSVLQYRLHLASTYANLGELNSRAEKPAAALPWYDKAVETLSTILEQEPRHTTARNYLSHTYSWQARTLDMLERFDQSIVAWNYAIEFDDNNKPELREGHAAALARAQQ